MLSSVRKQESEWNSLDARPISSPRQDSVPQSWQRQIRRRTINKTSTTQFRHLPLLPEDDQVLAREFPSRPIGSHAARPLVIRQLTEFSLTTKSPFRVVPETLLGHHCRARRRTLLQPLLHLVSLTLVRSRQPIPRHKIRSTVTFRPTPISPRVHATLQRAPASLLRLPSRQGHSPHARSAISPTEAVQSQPLPGINLRSHPRPKLKVRGALGQPATASFPSPILVLGISRFVEEDQTCQR